MDLVEVKKEPIHLDVTDTSVATQRFNARTAEKQDFGEGGYGTWINRLNVALSWDRWTLGTRLDSAVYWRRPYARADAPRDQLETLVAEGTNRFRNGIYPAKIWLTYAAPGVEVTAGDAYVQFGRGLVLSMRKIDDLGLDTTLRGAKVQVQKDPIAFTLVAGLANPSRVDEATGTSLMLPAPLPGSRAGTPVFGSDRIVGAQIQAGRGLPVVLSTQAARLTRCAPYRYDARGDVISGPFEAPFGSCAPSDTENWLRTLPAGQIVNASEVMTASQSVEVPDLWGHGKLYAEAAVQRRRHDEEPNDPYANGNALYASLATNFGPVMNTLEVKSYRNFYPLAGAVNSSRAAAFTNVQYSAPPTTEVITQDAMFNDFNVCVDGGRLRTDVRVSNELLVYGSVAYAYTRGELGGCDDKGHTVAALPANEAQATVWDGFTGLEWTFDRALSHVYASGGVRNNDKTNGDFFYRESHVEYAIQKHIDGPVSVEITGKYRNRKEEDQNMRGPENSAAWWREGENYVALKIAPKWVFGQGFEYTTNNAYPTYYFNGSVLYKFRSDSSVRLFAGQQRGGIRCISGICRDFPAFEGARLELTLRF